jgi:hypothetical protein
MGNANITNNAGQVTIEKMSLPASAQFTIDAESLMGNINSAFALTTKKKFARATASGKINGGSPLIRIRNSSGNIKLQNNSDSLSFLAVKGCYRLSRK